LVWRANKIDHPGGEHDDYANGAAGALHLASESKTFNPHAVPIGVGNKTIMNEARRLGIGGELAGGPSPFGFGGLSGGRLSVGIPVSDEYDDND
jgi:hypothetical protein